MTASTIQPVSDNPDDWAPNLCREVCEHLNLPPSDTLLFEALRWTAGEAARNAGIHGVSSEIIQILERPGEYFCRLRPLPDMRVVSASRFPGIAAINAHIVMINHLREQQAILDRKSTQ